MPVKTEIARQEYSLIGADPVIETKKTPELIRSGAVAAIVVAE